MQDLTSMLIKQGIDPAMAAAMAKSFKPKKDPAEKKKGRWYPGMESKSAKEEKEVDVAIHCQTCGDVRHQTVVMKVTKNSPDEQKTACSVCSKCAAYLLQFTAEELATIIILGEKPNPELYSASVRTRARLAKKLTPAQAIIYCTTIEPPVTDTVIATTTQVTEEVPNA